MQISSELTTTRDLRDYTRVYTTPLSPPTTTQAGVASIVKPAKKEKVVCNLCTHDRVVGQERSRFSIAGSNQKRM